MLISGKEHNDIIKNVRRSKFTSTSEYILFTLATFLIIIIYLVLLDSLEFQHLFGV